MHLWLCYKIAVVYFNVKLHKEIVRLIYWKYKNEKDETGTIPSLFYPMFCFIYACKLIGCIILTVKRWIYSNPNLLCVSLFQNDISPAFDKPYMDLMMPQASNNNLYSTTRTSLFRINYGTTHQNLSSLLQETSGHSFLTGLHVRHCVCILAHMCICVVHSVRNEICTTANLPQFPHQHILLQQ